MSALQLTPSQRRATAERDGTMLVSAGAGSGKTRVLVERLMAWVMDGHHLDEFLVITYTKAAAAELRGRILDTLSARLAENPGHRHLRRQLTRLSGCDICTVHAFCKRVLDEHGAAGGFFSGGRLLDEAERNLLMTRVLEDVLEEQYELSGEDSPFAALVAATADAKGDRRLFLQALTIYEKTRSHPDPESWMRDQTAAFAAAAQAAPEETVWGRLLLETAVHLVGYGLNSLWQIYEEIVCLPPLAAAYGPAFMEDIAQAERLRDALSVGWNAAQAEARTLTHLALKAARGIEDKSFVERCKQVREGWKKRAKLVKKMLESTAEEHREDFRALTPVVQGLFDTVTRFERQLAEEKQRLNVFDFGDLEHNALSLLTVRTDRGRSPTALSSRLAGRYTEVLVDEYQDISRMQEQIVQAVSRGGGNLFLVGDVRQSIYRFRLAEPALFLEKYNTFPDEADRGQPRRVLLEDNFRSRPEVLTAVNLLFADIMSRQTGEMAYTEREYLKASGTFSEDGRDRRCELLLADREASQSADGEEETLGKTQAEARVLAARLRALLDEGFPVTAGDGTARPVRPGDMAVLLRAPSLRAALYEQALAEEGIPCKTDGGGDFFLAPEVMTALALLQVVDNPRQDVALLAVLRSPAFGFDADRLAALRMSCPDGDLFDALEAAQEPGARACLTHIGRWRALAPDMTVYELLSQVYADTELLALYGAQCDGTLRQDNLTRLLDLSTRFEGGHYRGLFAFLQWVDNLRQNGSLVSGGSPARADAVTIMSIHRSKGLEFPVVVLGDAAKKFNETDMRSPVLFHAEAGVGLTRRDEARMIEYPTLSHLAVAQKLTGEMLAEEMRMLYVAMTRAREKLIVVAAPSSASDQLSKWSRPESGPLPPQLVSEGRSYLDWLSMHLARPEREHWLVTVRAPVDAMPKAALVEASAGEAAAPADGDLAAQLARRLHYVYPHGEAVLLPSKLTATALKGRGLDFEAAQDTSAQKHRSGPLFDRPRFLQEGGGALTSAERGTALHLAMQYVDFNRCVTRGGASAEVDRLRRDGFLTEEQAGCVDPGRIEGFFSSPLGRRVMASGRVKRECKFSLLVPAEELTGQGSGEEILLQGVIDCYFEEEGGLVVVDFKTDYLRPGDEARRAREYRVQVTAYARALQAITGKPVRECLLYFFNTGAAAPVETAAESD